VEEAALAKIGKFLFCGSYIERVCYQFIVVCLQATVRTLCSCVKPFTE